MLNWFPSSDRTFFPPSDCADSIGSTGVPAASGCNMPCSGNASEFCGGPLRLNVYNYTGTATPGSGSGTTGTVNSTGGNNGITDLPAGWEYSACWVYVSPCFKRDEF
jgi:hypothetical protein